MDSFLTYLLLISIPDNFTLLLFLFKRYGTGNRKKRQEQEILCIENICSKIETHFDHITFLLFKIKKKVLFAFLATSGLFSVFSPLPPPRSLFKTFRRIAQKRITSEHISNGDLETKKNRSLSV